MRKKVVVCEAELAFSTFVVIRSCTYYICRKILKLSNVLKKKKRKLKVAIYLAPPTLQTFKKEQKKMRKAWNSFSFLLLNVKSWIPPPSKEMLEAPSHIFL